MTENSNNWKVTNAEQRFDVNGQGPVEPGLPSYGAGTAEQGLHPYGTGTTKLGLPRNELAPYFGITSLPANNLRGATTDLS